MHAPGEHIARLVGVLDGRLETAVLRHLRAIIDHPQASPEPDAEIAFGFDASILLNVGKGRSGPDVVDYLGQRHTGPLIVPAQALMELWNGHVGGIHALGDELRQRFTELTQVLEELDPQYAHFRDESRRLLSDFEDRYGLIMEERTAGQLASLLDVFVARAVIPQLPGEPFSEIASRRQLRRIPPGFKDSTNGDFYIWAEFLLGLLSTRESGATFTKCVLVTDDRKPDWSSKGTTHPSLRAEVEALTGAEFETWSLDKLTRFVVASVSGSADAEPDFSDASLEEAMPRSS